MADSAWHPGIASSVPIEGNKAGHSTVVRVTHWIGTLCFLALLVTGVEILISHPRFYWGETGNVLTPSLFDIPIPASRASVKTGYGFVLKDQNGWSRSLHFQAAWIALFASLVYGLFSLWTGHFRNKILPAMANLSWRSLSATLAHHLRFQAPESEAGDYNILQRLAYSAVIFGLLPFMIWTGLAMSPGFTAAFPATVDILGGHQSARTLHFFATVALLLFLFVHVGMVWLAGFKRLMRAMISGARKEQA